MVRNIVYEAAKVGPSLGHECVNVRFNGYGFELINLDDHQRLPGLGARIFARGTRYYRSIKRLLPTFVHRVVFKIVTAGLRLHQARRAPLDTINLAIERYATSHGGSAGASKPILLLLDSTWNMQIWRSIDSFRKAGGHVSAVLYDLIPFTHPETVEQHTGSAHTKWWLTAPLHIDSVMCISKTVRKEFLEWQSQIRLERRIPASQVDYFYLGADIRRVVGAELLGAGDKTNYGLYFLVVGSIEPRKNHRTILDAFEILWRDQQPINLVIVGSHGWMSEAFLARVANHPLRGKRLFLLRRASDEQLAYLYEHALALVIASLAEGFGLPIVEAFQHGTRVVCSDIEVFREVAGDAAAYFAASNPDELAGKLLEMYQTPPSQLNRDLPLATVWHSWEQSAASLLNKLDKAQHTTEI